MEAPFRPSVREYSVIAGCFGWTGRGEKYGEACEGNSGILDAVFKKKGGIGSTE